MKKKSVKREDDLRSEYDFRGGERGKFYQEFQEGSNLICLDPELSDIFPDSEAVNRALRPLAQLVRELSRLDRK